MLGLSTIADDLIGGTTLGHIVRVGRTIVIAQIQFLGSVRRYVDGLRLRRERGITSQSLVAWFGGRRCIGLMLASLVNRRWLGGAISDSR